MAPATATSRTDDVPVPPPPPSSASTVAAPSSTAAPTGRANAVGAPAAQAPVHAALFSPGSEIPVPVCLAADLRVSLDVQPSVGTRTVDPVEAVIVVTDTSSSPCAVDGFAALEVESAGTVVALDPIHVDQPGRPARVVLQDGQSAFAGVQWAGGSGCTAVSAFWMTLPGATAALPVEMVAPGGATLPLDLCLHRVEVGPFWPTGEGVTAFADRS